MSELIIIEKGDEVESDTLNFNFQCLDEKVISTNQRIETVSASVKSVQSTLTSQLSSSILSSLQAIYPVGSLYIGTTDTCPIANLFGTWEKVSEGRVLQGVSGSQVAGKTVEAGLPNITGTVSNFWCGGPSGGFSGALYAVGSGTQYGGGSSSGNGIGFNASKSNSIYGKSNTVQPPAYLVNVWKRTA